MPGESIWTVKIMSSFTKTTSFWLAIGYTWAGCEKLNVVMKTAPSVSETHSLIVAILRLDTLQIQQFIAWVLEDWLWGLFNYSYTKKRHLPVYRLRHHLLSENTVAVANVFL